MGTNSLGFMHPQYYDAIADIGTSWERPHPGPFYWNGLEPSQGSRNWTASDTYVQNAQTFGQNLQATVWPYAEWDQSGTHSPAASSIIFADELGLYRHAPVNTTAYAEFLTALVERYDGDGVDDMAGLTQPVKYWEISNEPAVGSDILFFDGTAQEYFDLLKLSYETIKAADPDAIVVPAGLAGPQAEVQAFWSDVFALGGGQYMDVITFHSIGGPYDLHWADMNTFLTAQGVGDKPRWITEIELSSPGLGQASIVDADWGKWIVKTHVNALANGAERLLYVGLDAAPGEAGKNLLDLSNADRANMPAFADVPRNPAYNAYKAMAGKIDDFTAVTATASTEASGSVKFTTSGGDVYALWGSGTAIPAEISGTITVTDLTNTATVIDAATLTLTDSPVFVQIGEQGTDSDSGSGSDSGGGSSGLVTVADASVTEGDSLARSVTLTVTLASAQASDTAVTYQTADGTAAAGSDYTAAAGTMTIAAGETSGTLTLSVLGDIAVEANETFTVAFTDAGGVQTVKATVTIAENDGFIWSASDYLAANPDLITAGITTETALDHYVTFGYSESRLLSFDGSAYLVANPDLGAAGLAANDALTHYKTFGANENRILSAEAYLNANPDLLALNFTDAQAGEHYVAFGKNEGRVTGFDSAGYLMLNTDLASLGIADLVSHWQSFGQAEGRRIFDPGAYIAANKDVATAGVDVYYHYVASGQGEGRSLTPSSLAVEGLG
ncbi:MAG: hypothetical protein NXI16_10900 [Alphaproteobacteria bacterium]|nr:hypothetical protein [Alphaproteobacteria bacterium]